MISLWYESDIYVVLYVLGLKICYRIDRFNELKPDY